MAVAAGKVGTPRLGAKALAPEAPPGILQTSEENYLSFSTVYGKKPLSHNEGHAAA